MSFFPRSRPVRMLSLLTLAVSPQVCAAQVPGYRARLDSLFNTLDSNQRAMGRVSIRKAGRVVYQRSIGYRDSSANGWVRTDSLTMYRVGSVTKPFTAVMVFQLIEEHRLSLDTRLSRFFPQMPNSDSITIRDLLGHTSGLADYTQGLDLNTPLSRDSLLRRIAAGRTQFRVGTQRRYSNSNFLLLGYIVEALTNSSYSSQLQCRIVRRVGLRRTRVGGTIVPASNESRAYYFSDGHWEQQPDDAIENGGGGGSIVSTPDDLTRFLAALFRGQLMSERSLSEMTNGFDDGTQKSGKGLSPFRVPGTTKTGYAHDGSIGAHTALVGYVPADSLSLALTINGHNYPLNKLFFHVWGILLDTRDPLPSFAALPVPDTIARALVGVFSAPEYGLTITVRQNGSALEAQTTGQAPFALTYVGSNRVVNVRDGILLDFADAAGGVAPHFTLYQQKMAIRLRRKPSTP
jgi:D-alanyl-D-alanine carboxypeptidase